MRPLNSPAWQALAATANSASPSPRSTHSTHTTACGITLDWSRQRISTATMQAMATLAADCGLQSAAQSLVAGNWMNPTESRRVIHTLLREPASTGSADADRAEIQQSLVKMGAFVEAFHAGTRQVRSVADRRYTDVVVIGIGGSALGPQLAVSALSRFRVEGAPRIHFVANIDGAAMDDVLAVCPPLSTLVVVISKTFTTEETTVNAEAARAWLAEHAGPDAFPHQFVAVTANADEAVKRGYRREAVLTFPVGVGGRFSLWSAVGLPIALSIGMAGFRELLAGAHAMDQHFAHAPFADNLPLLMAMVGVWNRNVEGIASLAVLPYAERLSLLSKHLQQLEMESNGKSVDLDGARVDYPTCPVLFGEPGTNGQHSFHQLLHQGTDRAAHDIIIVREREGTGARGQDQHERLIANAFAQANAFWDGNRREGLEAWRVHEGMRPVMMIELERLDPAHLGALVALYEHKVFAQGKLWHLNSFDQWGVELGKVIAKTLLPQVRELHRDQPFVTQIQPTTK